MAKMKRPPNESVDSYPYLLDAALTLHGQGFNVLAVGKNKRSILPWKKWQTERQSALDLQQMLQHPNAEGLALVLGNPFNHLALRDFDTRKSYCDWREQHPALARQLPTAKTARGFHVYHVSPGLRTQKFVDGELRGQGAYAVAPPSSHASGKLYRWINPLSVDKLLRVEPGVFAPSDPHTAQDAAVGWASDCHRETEETETPKSFVDLQGISAGAKEAIDLTLPTAVGQRNAKLFTLVRRLKGLPEYHDATPAMLMAVARECHRLASPVIGTKPFDLTLDEFLAGWQRAHTPLGQGALDTAFSKALAAKLGPTELNRFDSDYGSKIFRLCRELQRIKGSEPFFLSCRSIEVRLKIDRKQAWRFLCRLGVERTLEVVKTGTQRSATRYRFLEPLEPR